MASTGDEYVIPFKNDEAKDKFRKWMGKHNGMSMLHADWVYTDEGGFHSGYDAYKVKVTNPKTVLLLVLTFPEAMSEEQVAENKPDWESSPVLSRWQR